MYKQLAENCIFKKSYIFSIIYDILFKNQNTSLSPIFLMCNNFITV